MQMLRLAAEWLVALALGIAIARDAAEDPWIDPPPSGQYWQRNPRDPRWVQGQIDLDVSAGTVWQRVADVPRWPALFSDIASFSIQSRSTDGSRWVVRFESRTVGHGEHDYKVELNAGNHSGRVVIEVPGVRAATYASVAPIDGHHSRVNYAAFAEPAGLLGWLFVSERGLRRNEERLVERTLHDLERAFPANDRGAR